MDHVKEGPCDYFDGCSFDGTVTHGAAGWSVVFSDAVAARVGGREAEMSTDFVRAHDLKDGQRVSVCLQQQCALLVTKVDPQP